MSYKIVFFGWVVLLLSLSTVSCNLVRSDGAFLKHAAMEYLFYAHPSGGIRAYHPSLRNFHIITEDYDFHPNYLSSGVVLFLRFELALFDTKPSSPTLMKWDPKTNRTKKIKVLSSITSAPDPKDQIYFVDDGSRILLMNHYKDASLIDIVEDKTIESFSVSSYASHYNYYSEDKNCWIGWLMQYPHQSIFKNNDRLDIPMAQSAIFSINHTFDITLIDQMPKELMFNESYHGIAYVEKIGRLFFSRNHQLFLSDLKSDKDHHKIAEGIQPFFYREDHPFENPMASFPWPVTTLWLTDKGVELIGTSSHLSIIDKEEGEYTPLSGDSFYLSIKNEDDHYQIFNRLSFIAKLKDIPSTYFLASLPVIRPGHKLSHIQRDSVDFMSIFSIIDGNIETLWVNSGQNYAEVWLEDINGNGQMEIINQYCASAFPCPDHIMLNSRSLIWIDVYSLNQDGLYESMNESFPSIYEDLSKRLALVQDELELTKKTQAPLFCEEDIKLLENLLERSIALSSKK